MKQVYKVLEFRVSRAQLQFNVFNAGEYYKSTSGDGKDVKLIHGGYMLCF